jgi:hypothetical protein
MSFKAFKMKKARLKMFFKVINKKYKPLKSCFNRLSGLYAALRELVHWWFRFLMSRTGFLSEHKVLTGAFLCLLFGSF